MVAIMTVLLQYHFHDILDEFFLRRGDNLT
jgi:hypothetical protein